MFCFFSYGTKREALLVLGIILVTDHIAIKCSCSFDAVIARNTTKGYLYMLEGKVFSSFHFSIAS